MCANSLLYYQTTSMAYLTDCDFLKTPVLLIEIFFSSCVMQCLGWIAKIIRIWNLPNEENSSN